MATSEQITAYKAVAQAIKSATADGENSADKVGGVLVNIINALISDETLAQYAKQIGIGSQDASQANDGTVWGALIGLAQSLEDYALKTDIPNVSGFATTSTTDELAENIDSVSQDVETLQDEVARMETTPTKVNEIITGVTGSRFVSGSGVTIGDLATKADLDELSSEVGDMKSSIQDNANDISALKASIKTIPCEISDGTAYVKINAFTEEDYASGVAVVLKDTYHSSYIPLQYLYDAHSHTLYFWFVAYEPSYGDFAVWKGETDDILGASKISCEAYLLS